MGKNKPFTHTRPMTRSYRAKGGEALERERAAPLRARTKTPGASARGTSSIGGSSGSSGSTIRVIFFKLLF